MIEFNIANGNNIHIRRGNKSWMNNFPKGTHEGMIKTEHSEDIKAVKNKS